MMDREAWVDVPVMLAFGALLLAGIPTRVGSKVRAAQIAFIFVLMFGSMVLSFLVAVYGD